MRNRGIQIKKFLVRLLVGLQKKNKMMSIDEQLNFIDSFPDPSDDFERVYFQYKSNTVDVSRISVYLLNVMGNCLIPLFMVYFLLNRLIFQRTEEKKKTALVIWYPNKEGKEYDYSAIVPYDSLVEEFGDVYSLKLASWGERLKGIWGKEAFLVWGKLFLRYPLFGYMNLSCLIHLMYINKIIKINNPRIILEARREEAFASTLVTHFCESIDTEYAMFMHGFIWPDKVFSFVRFSRIYVWEQFFIKVYLKVHAMANRFYIYSIRPSSKNGRIDFKGVKADFIYYLSPLSEYENSNEYLSKLYNALIILKKSGNVVKVRPHPRWSYIDKIITVFSDSGIEIEDTTAITIKESLLGCKCAIGGSLSVILQAYYLGIPIVIDDVAKSYQFMEFINSETFFMSLPHRLLSEIIGKDN